MEQKKNAMDITGELHKSGSDAYLMMGDSLEADMYFATRFFAPDAFTYLQTKNSEVMLISQMEKGRAEIESRMSNIRTMQDYGYREKIKARGDPATAYCDCLAEMLQQEGVRKVAVPRNFPLYTAQVLKELGFSVTPIKSPFRELRTRKDGSEIQNMRYAQDACEQAMQAAIDLISNSTEEEGILYSGEDELTSQRVRSAIEHRLLDFGCEADSTIVSCGKDAANPHSVGEGALRANESIVIDIFPRNKTSRYHADMTRTVVKGEPSEKLADMYDAVLKSQEAALEMVKPGIKCSEIHNRVCEVLEERGYDTLRKDSKVGFIHSTGHGVGIDIHELPPVGENDTILEEGNVITIEPGLYYPDIGGIRIEDMVVVTAEGCENLTKFEKKFVL